MDLTISQMLQMQRDLFDAQGRKWAPMEPEYGGEFILYMVEEIGEVISIWKKKGERAIVEDPSVRSAFLEEMADVLMFYNDVLLCYGITADELKQAYTEKFEKNMKRW